MRIKIQENVGKVICFEPMTFADNWVTIKEAEDLKKAKEEILKLRESSYRLYDSETFTYTYTFKK